jgi:hypothetical protein
MTDAPERIWAWVAGMGMPIVARIVETNGWAEYIRADIHEAEAARLREALSRISLIEDDVFSSDWDEINKARFIARAALGDSHG